MNHNPDDKKSNHMEYRYAIDPDRCKGCGLCVSVCPKKNLQISTSMNKKGYYPAVQAFPENCIHCALCCMMCPDVAIMITELEEEAV